MPLLDTSTIPSGRACLQMLDTLQVRYRSLGRKPYMSTGVVINSELGGIRYYANGGVPLICDCRLAVILAKLGPRLRAKFGITAIRHSGSYVVRRTRGIRHSRMSLHAYGLAIDVHEVVARGRHLTVRKDYRAGLEQRCSPAAPLLNRLACTLVQSRAFLELLTPDSNRAHRDHFHLGIAPLPPSRRRGW